MFNYLSIFICLPTLIFAQNKVERTNITDSSKGYNLKETYQNPFGAVQILEFAVPDTVESSICVFSNKNDGTINYCDTVAVINKGILFPGYYRAIWDAKDSNNRYVPNGIYSIYIYCSMHNRNASAKSFSGYSRVFVLH